MQGALARIVTMAVSRCDVLAIAIRRRRTGRKLTAPESEQCRSGSRAGTGGWRRAAATNHRPPRKAELPGKDKITVHGVKRRQENPVDKQPDKDRQCHTGKECRCARQNMDSARLKAMPTFSLGTGTVWRGDGKCELASGPGQVGLGEGLERRAVGVSSGTRESPRMLRMTNSHTRDASAPKIGPSHLNARRKPSATVKRVDRSVFG